MDISISEHLYRRLAGLAKGFETPEQVINRLIDAFESDKTKRPELFFNPANEDDFKQAFMDGTKAKVELFKGNGTCENGSCNTGAISANSSLRANIWSGYLRGWKAKGIVRALFTVQDYEALSSAGVESVNWGDCTFSRLENDTIIVEKEGRSITSVMPW